MAVDQMTEKTEKVPMIGLAEQESWNLAIAHKWADFMTTLRVPRSGIAVEVAPGDTNKIGKALELYGFTGRLYVIEPNQRALESITSQYRESLKGVDVVPVGMTLGDSSRKVLPKSLDLVLANHPLDDMILGTWLHKLEGKEFEHYFDVLYAKFPNKTIANWEAITSDAKLLREIQEGVLNEWKDLFCNNHPHWTLISQYKSYFFQSRGVYAPDEEAKKVLGELKGMKLDHRSYSSDLTPYYTERLKMNLEDPERWAFLKTA